MKKEEIPKTFKAAVLTEINKPLEIKNLEINELLPGQVLVKILYSGVCRSQLMEIEGKRGEDNWIPHLLGHEGSGIVVKVGSAVTKFKPEDEVILTWIKSEGLEEPGAKYICEGEVINAGTITTFSQYSVVSENRLVTKPKNLPFDTAVLYGCALPTGAGMVLKELEISNEASVLVIGLGGIGLSVIAMLLALKIENITAVDISLDKLKEVKSWGVRNILNPNNEYFYEEIEKISNKGFDFCIESAGSVSTIEMGFSLIKKQGGKLLFASHPPEGELIALSPHELISGKQIFGSWGGGAEPDEDLPKFYDLFSSSNIPVEKLLSNPYSLEQINNALDDLKEGKVFRPLIKMDL